MGYCLIPSQSLTAKSILFRSSSISRSSASCFSNLSHARCFSYTTRVGSTSLKIHPCHDRLSPFRKLYSPNGLVRCQTNDEETIKENKGGKIGKRTDLKKIMILGAGPIVIGQACEFDYSGTQACKALKEEGYEVVLINSNPATIMTDPELADRTYVTPMTPELVEKVLEKERPDALLPTMGGQTALNLAVALAESGALEKYGIELIGAKLDAIKKAEDRELFKQAMKNIGIKTPPSGIGTTLEECIEIAGEIGEFPLIIRPAFTLGGTGGGIAYNKEEFESICKAGLAASLTSQVLVEKSLLGWKEYELEVMRDLADNVVIICSIENIDPMGVHTGDSITVAPAQTLTDKEYQRLRDYSIAIIREIGVECGGSNVQFAVNPADGEVMVIEMNPRVSRSSALASKATGFPIAKMAAKLSVGYSLDQIPNDITKKTPASFEPSIDYVVTKIPRFAFEKFPGSQPILTTQMKSVGEAMALGRTFQESFQKAVRSLEYGYSGWGCEPIKQLDWDWEQLKYSLRVPNPDRIHALYAAMKKGMKLDEIHELSYIDKWFLTQLKELVDVEQYLLAQSLSNLTKEDFYEVKKRGFSDKQIAFATKSTEKEVRSKRISLGVLPAYKRVDTCAAEFEANTPYMYSSYDFECESAPTLKKKVLILGGGPNRIGQGIEFDYCCCHTSFALQDAGYETIMMNSNPETVSTDYDTSDRLYFEPLTVEDVFNVIALERPDGIIVQFGGQTPLKLALPIQRYLDENKLKCASGDGHVRIWGTSPDSIDAAEDRERFNAILNELKIEQPRGGIAKSEADALSIAKDIGYPVVVRPSYVLGGRAMEIVYSDDKLVTYLENAVEVDPERPVLVDKYLSDAIEIDVDALADSHGNVTIGGIMEHIELAGVHSGDSACSLPTKTIPSSCLETIRNWTTKLAKRLNVCGLMNCQYAITMAGEVFLLEGKVEVEMLARWKAVVTNGRRQKKADAEAIVYTPSNSLNSPNGEYNDEIWGRVPSIHPDGAQQTLLARARVEKNRLVQRLLVALRLADGTKDVYFTKKQAGYACFIQHMRETHDIIEMYAHSLFDVSVCVRAFAGNSSDVRSREAQSVGGSFMLAAEAIEETGHEFLDQVYQRVLRRIDERIIEFERVQALIRERAKLQLDVDYAKRTLVVAQQRGDVNQIADRKRALQIAQLRRREATSAISKLVRRYDDRQALELECIVNEFACLVKQFFRDGAVLLRAAEPASSSRHSARLALHHTASSDSPPHQDVILV